MEFEKEKFEKYDEDADDWQVRFDKLLLGIRNDVFPYKHAQRVYRVYLYIFGKLGVDEFTAKDFKQKYHMTTESFRWFITDFVDLGLVESFRVQGKGVARHYRKSKGLDCDDHWNQILDTLKETFKNKKELLKLK